MTMHTTLLISICCKPAIMFWRARIYSERDCGFLLIILTLIVLLEICESRSSGSGFILSKHATITSLSVYMSETSQMFRTGIHLFVW